MSELIAAVLKAGWTTGSVGIWTFGPIIVGMMAVGLWRGMPALLDAWTRRSDAEASRINREFERLGNQITASDARHADCEKRCERMQERLDEAIQMIDGLRRQAQQQQLSAIRVGATPTTITETLIATLDRLPSGPDAR